MPSRTEGQHSFAMIPSAEIQRSVFDRSCGLKTTFDAGLVVPIFADEALPGDTMEMDAAAFGRLPTLIHPVMENMFIDFFFFAVPIRLIWDNWQKFNGEQRNPGDSTDFLVPQMTAAVGPPMGHPEKSVSDYLGLPIGVDCTHSSLWHRAYNLIWNEWFRDQNLQNSIVVDTDDGPDSPSDYNTVRPRGKRHDYFTSCLPWPQKGTAVALPLGTSAPVVGSGTLVPTFLGTTTGGASAIHPAAVGANSNIQLTTAGSGATQDMKWATTSLSADLSAATAATINALRQAFQIQRMFERDARGGSRYTEILRSHFGVVSPDGRLQRPEYLGGGTARINVNPVAATSINTANSIHIGELGGFGTFSHAGVGFRKSFTEHCVILGLASLRADLNYQQGIERQFLRRTRFDFYWPALAHLGEQPVYAKELESVGDTAGDSNNVVFGYQERYAEYRYKPSKVTGAMRSSAAQSLDAWHLAQDFAGVPPVLNASFIAENPPLERIIAYFGIGSVDCMLDMFFKYRCTRPMPVFGVPGLIDHF